MTSTPGRRGLSAFPLTPITQDAVDEAAFVGIVERVAATGVDSITVLGSTGSYAYLDRAERRQVVELTISAAGAAPVLAGIGHVRTREVLRHLDDAQTAGAAGVLLAPVTYQGLTDDEVYELFADVDAASSVPVVVYDNPGTTQVSFSDELHGRISELEHVAAIKIPPVTGGVDAVRARVDSLRARLAPEVAVGISGDQAAADALVAGCDTWYSVLAGTLPGPCRAIVDAVTADDAAQAQHLSRQLDPLWRLFVAHGSYRVVSALAEELGLVRGPNLPRPVLPLDDGSRADVRAALTSLREEGLVEP
ncbi:dihydrodipicolinate synthase family protein [Janibacter anophelis]|uniref:dihydrodipicolinate synthase family protein n=1 Tax=Janibacter anophelis TaxID=319054 RepID=UPI003F814637